MFFFFAKNMVQVFDYRYRFPVVADTDLGFAGIIFF